MHHTRVTHKEYIFNKIKTFFSGPRFVLTT